MDRGDRSVWARSGLLAMKGPLDDLRVAAICYGLSILAVLIVLASCDPVFRPQTEWSGHIGLD